MRSTNSTLRMVCTVGLCVVAAAGEKTAWQTPQHEEERARVETLLAAGKFQEARDAALPLNRRVPDDVRIYALLAEAQIQLGEFEAAEENVNWMFRLRNPEPVSLVLGARLREAFGDIPGALEFCAQAMAYLTPAETAERDRVLLTAIGIQTRAKQFDQAAKHLSQLADSPKKAAALKALEAARAQSTKEDK